MCNVRIPVRSRLVLIGSMLDLLPGTQVDSGIGLPPHHLQRPGQLVPGLETQFESEMLSFFFF